MSNGRIVIAAYKPKAGKEAALAEVVSEHMPVLRSENLVTDREAIVMHSKNGTILEVFEWASPEAIEEAHRNEAVQVLWAKFFEACDYVPVSECPEAAGPFSEFLPGLPS